MVDVSGSMSGTKLEQAKAALPGSERLSIVVLLTDLPSVGEQSPDRIAETAGAWAGGSRIFTVAVGHDVNTYLLDRLATEGPGRRSTCRLERGDLLGKVRYPALMNLRIAQSPVELRMLQPARLPDLLYGEELVVFGRHTGSGSGPLIVTGERNGRTERIEIRDH